MKRKNNGLHADLTGNKTATDRQQVATKMLPMLPTKIGVSATSCSCTTRVITGFDRGVADVAVVASWNGTSLKPFFNSFK